MEYKLKVEQLPKTKDEKSMFSFKLSTYKDTVEGKFERSELRQMIETIDNAI